MEDITCVSKSVKDIVLRALDAGKPELAIGVLSLTPNCEEILRKMETVSKVSDKAVKAAKTGPPKREPWGIKPVYYDENGVATPHDSPSELVKYLGLKMSGAVCDINGEQCRATSAIEILRIHGYTVSGNGEPRKASQGGKKLTVWHPDALDKAMIKPEAEMLAKTKGLPPPKI